MVYMKILDFKVIKLSDKEMIRNYKTMDWCKLPYEGHNRGCPNYSKCFKIYKPIDVNCVEPFIFVCAVCDLKTYVEEMRLLHPSWSYRHLVTPYYWQGHIEKLLMIETRKEMWRNKMYFVSDKPEANRIDVISTLKRLHYDIERQPVNVIWKVNLIANLKWQKKE